jgi:hypothetical protein
MKGLYVYGALLMGMCFAVGALEAPFIMGLAIITCAAAALAEAMHEVSRSMSIPAIDALAPVVALLSWLFTAVTAVFTLLALVGVL